jgi:hypothetical protein
MRASLKTSTQLAAPEVAIKSRYNSKHVMENQFYQYQPLLDLHDIRLLHIQSGIGDDEVSCILSHVSLTAPLKYETLSYTWGDTETTRVIYVEGKKLQVTTNLYSALLRLRFPDCSRTLWVDAICINQVDIPERNRQVEIMREIYSNQEVIVWLGDETDLDCVAFDFIHIFDDEHFRNNGINWDNKEAVWSLHYSLIKEKPTLARAVWKLLQRPWFHRVWIIQEVAMAKKATLICGKHTVDWSSFLRMTNFIRKNDLDSSFGMTVHALTTIEVMTWLQDARLGNASQEPALLRLLDKTQLCSATDSRDRIFALLGVASDADSAGVTVNYSIECTELYKRFARHNIFEKKDLACLSYPKNPKQPSKLTLPSWVPDWSLDSNSAPFCPLHGQGFNVARGTSLALSSFEDDIIMAGFIVDTIREVGTGYMTTESSTPFFDPDQPSLVLHVYKTAMTECDEIASIANPYPTGEDFKESYWRALVCNRLLSGEVPPVEMTETIPIFPFVFEIIDDLAAKRYDKLDRSMLEKVTAAFPYGSAVGKWASGRAFCSTKSRFLGWVPRGAVAGDLVCVFGGAEVPYVLRLNTDGSYKLLGDCYIHGIMESEAMARSDLIEQKFVIR